MGISLLENAKLILLRLLGEYVDRDGEQMETLKSYKRTHIKKSHLNTLLYIYIYNHGRGFFAFHIPLIPLGKV